MFMIQVDTRSWWLEKYKNYPDSYWELSKVAADEKWRKAAEAYIKAVVNHVEEKYPDKIYCYFLLGGCTTEWFSSNDKEGYNDIKERAYKKYTGNDKAVIPDYAALNPDGKTAFLNPETDSDVISYRKFHNKLIADTILYFADGLRKLLGKDRLIGVYYGYVLELGGERLWNDGSIAYEKVFDSNSIDIIASPSAYTLSRRHDGTSAYMITADTLFLNNKLYYLEFDQRTYLKPLQFDVSLSLPGETDKLATEQDTVDVMRRDFMLTLTKGFGIWWFDMFEGWFYSERLMNEIARYCEIFAGLSQKKTDNNSEIAFIVDPESLYYVNKKANLNGELLTWERNELAKLGAPYDIYSASSLGKIDFSSYKFIILSTFFKFDSETADIIEKKLKKDGKTILFMYAPFYISDDGFSVGKMNAVTEMNLKELEEPENVIQYKDICFGYSYAKDKMFYVEIEGDFYALEKQGDTEILGRYQGSLKPALVRRKKSDYSTVFCGSGFVRADILRDIAKDAGVHIFSEDNDNITFVNSEFIGVYHRKSTDAVVNVKKDGKYKDLFTGKEYTTRNKKLVLPWSETETAQLFILESEE